MIERWQAAVEEQCKSLDVGGVPHFRMPADDSQLCITGAPSIPGIAQP